MGSKKKAKKNGLPELTLGMVPSPAKDEDDGRICEADAREWLATWAGSYLRVLRAGFSTDTDATQEEDVRDAFCMLADEVVWLTDACIGLVNGKGVGVRVRQLRPGDLDFPSAMHSLALVGVARPDGSDPSFDGFDMLARHLARMLGEREAA